MARNFSFPRPVTLFAMLAFCALAACAQSFGQCDEGVNDLSNMPNVTVQNPC